MSASGSNAYVAVVQANPDNPSAIPVDPIMQLVNFASADLDTNIDTSISNNISGTRRVKDVTVTGFAVGGGYSYEMTFDNSLDDELIAGFLWSNWVDNGNGSFTIKDSDVYTPFLIERGHPDIEEYFVYRGMACNTWTIAIADQSAITGEYQFVGLETDSNQVPLPGAVYTPATDNPVFSAVTNIPEIIIDGVIQAECDVKEWSLEINNNVTPKTGVGKFGACGTNPHKLNVTLTLTVYFVDTSLQQKLINGTPFSFEWTMTDGDGNSYTFLLPRLKLSENSTPVEGDDADIMENAVAVGLDDTTEDSALTITRIPA